MFQSKSLWLLGIALNIYSINSSGYITGFDTTPAPNMSMPAVNVSYVDPVYGTKVTRVTTASQVTDQTVPWVRHEYSRRPAFNADSSYAMMYAGNGSNILYSVDKVNNKMSFVKSLNGGGAGREPNWHPTELNSFYYFDQNALGGKIYKHNVTTNQSVVHRDLKSRLVALFPTATGMWTKEEGRPSNDGKIWCMQVGGPNYSVIGLISYNIETDQILGSMATNGDAPDHISTSPKGNYCVPSWGYGKGTRAYNLTFSSFTQLHDTSEHSDLAITKEGREVYVYTDYGSGPDAGYVVMVDMATGARTRLFSLYGENASFSAMHLSGVGTKRNPGHMVISFYGCYQNYGAQACTNQWFKEKVIIIELKANPIIYNMAHTHYGNSGYWGETQAVPNDDLTKVLFISSWRSTAERDISSYMIDVPAGSIGGVPQPPQPASCSFNGQTVAHGSSITAYLAASVPYGSTCTSQQRTCNNGVLSGSYTNSSCSVQPPSQPVNCSFNGQTVLHGSSVTAYLAASVPYGSTCTSQQRTCNNGVLSGSYANSSCSVQPQPPQGGLVVTLTSVNRHSAYGAKLDLKTNVAAKCRFAWASGYNYGVLYDNFTSASNGLTHNKTVSIGDRVAVTGYAVCKKNGSSEQKEIRISIPAYTRGDYR